MMRCVKCGAQPERVSILQFCPVCNHFSEPVLYPELQDRIDKLNEPDYKFFLAELYLEWENYNLSLKYLEKCIEIDPLLFELWVLKGLAELQRKPINRINTFDFSVSLRKALRLIVYENRFALKLRLKYEIIKWMEISIYECEFMFNRCIVDEEVNHISKYTFSKFIRATNFLLNSCDLDDDEKGKLYWSFFGMIDRTQSSMEQCNVTFESRNKISGMLNLFIEVRDQLDA